MSYDQENVATLKTINHTKDERQPVQPNQNYLAFQDIKNGLIRWPVCLMLAYQDIKLRYRRSILGPFWITISMAVTVYCMGFLYAHLFHIELEKYFPFLTAGMLGWAFISTMLMELTDGLVSADAFIKQIKLPYTLHIHRIVTRNLIIFFHNIIVIIPILVFFHLYAKINAYTLLLIPGLMLIYFNAITYGLILAMLGTRYRDISQIIKSLIQVIFFVTPVMWSPDVISERHYFFIDFNPFYAFIQLIRAPLLGTCPSFNLCLFVFCLTILGVFIAFKFFARYRARIIYWL